MIRTKSAQTTRLWLGYSGLIPFIALALLNAIGTCQWSMALFSAYSCAILSFLAGSLWGQMICRAHPERIRLIMFSNVFTLLAWTGLIFSWLGFPISGLLVLTLGFLSLFAVEHWQLLKYFSVDELVAQKTYWQMRARLTAVVVLSHLIVIASSY